MPLYKIIIVELTTGEGSFFDIGFTLVCRGIVGRCDHKSLIGGGRVQSRLSAHPSVIAASTGAAMCGDALPSSKPLCSTKLPSMLPLCGSKNHTPNKEMRTSPRECGCKHENAFVSLCFHDSEYREITALTPCVPKNEEKE